MKKITCMKELNDWILHPTKDKPNVMEWFMDWFFKHLIMRDKIERAKKAVGTLIIFTEVCEGMSQQEASSLVLGNLKTYARLKNHEWAKKLYDTMGI